jgi:hypothetical protein
MGSFLPFLFSFFNQIRGNNMKKIILLMLLVILISGCVESYNPFQREFAGIKLNFRANLDEARNTPVYPNETSLRNVLLNENVEEIGLAYIPNDTVNSFYLAASYELAYKLTVINKYYFSMVKPINSIPVNSSSEVLSMASSQKPIIILLGPSETSSTLVNVSESFIEVHGKSFEEVNRTYNDLDLATDKLLLVLMENSADNVFFQFS